MQPDSGRCSGAIIGEVQLLYTRALGTNPLEREVIIIKSTWDALYKGLNKGRSGSWLGIVDFWPYSLGVALARSITLTIIYSNSPRYIRRPSNVFRVELLVVTDVYI